MAVKKHAIKSHLGSEGGFKDQNAHRAVWARRALAAFQEETGLTDADGLDTVLTDLLCDLVHLCGQEGIEFERVLLRARTHYDAETRDA